MTTKSAFDADEWGRVQEAPMLAALTVTLADRGGTLREGIALGKAYAEARRDAGSELIEELISSPPRIDPESIGPPDDVRANAPQQIRQAVALVNRRATPEEARQYRDFILGVADVVARAAKKGGVLGLGGKEVSEEERAVLDELAAQLAAGQR
jgi:hypothetical protein